MIYIYRALWYLFYIPVLIIEFVICTIGIPVYIMAGFIWYVKTGDVENTPDKFIPGNLVSAIDYFYKDLQK